MIEDEKLPFTSHLEELRKRLITVFIAVGVGFVASFWFKEHLFNILVNPLINVMKEGETLIYTGLPEAFFTYLKVAFLTGLMVASPVILYQFWMFVAPGLYKKERKYFFSFIFISSFLMFTVGVTVTFKKPPERSC